MRIGSPGPKALIAAGAAALVVVVAGVAALALALGWFESEEVAGSAEGFQRGDLAVGGAADGEWPEYGLNRRRTRANPALDLTIAAGETIFLIGGNGSGKSTLLKVITALYHPTDGAVRVDGEAIESSTYGAYRSLFSAVFSDYHLFDRLYGLDSVTEEQVRALLRHHSVKAEGVFGDGGQGLAQPAGREILLMRLPEHGLEHCRFESRSLEGGILGSVNVNDFLRVLHGCLPPGV